MASSDLGSPRFSVYFPCASIACCSARCFFNSSQLLSSSRFTRARRRSRRQRLRCPRACPSPRRRWRWRRSASRLERAPGGVPTRRRSPAAPTSNIDCERGVHRIRRGVRGDTLMVVVEPPRRHRRRQPARRHPAAAAAAGGGGGSLAVLPPPSGPSRADARAAPLLGDGASGPHDSLHRRHRARLAASRRRLRADCLVTYTWQVTLHGARHTFRPHELHDALGRRQVAPRGDSPPPRSPLQLRRPRGPLALRPRPWLGSLRKLRRVCVRPRRPLTPGSKFTLGNSGCPPTPMASRPIATARAETMV